MVFILDYSSLILSDSLKFYIHETPQIIAYMQNVSFLFSLDHIFCRLKFKSIISIILKKKKIKMIKGVKGIFDTGDIPYCKTDRRRSGTIYTIKKKKKRISFYTSTLYLQLALATHARFKYALWERFSRMSSGYTTMQTYNVYIFGVILWFLVQCKISDYFVPYTIRNNYFFS